MQKGFTIIEVLLSLAIIGILAGISTPIYQSFQVRNDLDIATVTIAQSLRRAQTLSQSVDNDSTWGIDVRSGSITIYKGVSYIARDSAYDELFEMPSSLTPSGMNGVVFNTLTGLPQKTGSIILTSNANETRTIIINSKGMVSY